MRHNSLDFWFRFGHTRSMRERIGLLTGGGDCPGLNTVIRAVVKSASKRGWETIGFLDGYEGLLEPLRYRALDYKEMDALLFMGDPYLTCRE